MGSWQILDIWNIWNGEKYSFSNYQFKLWIVSLFFNAACSYICITRSHSGTLCIFTCCYKYVYSLQRHVCPSSYDATLKCILICAFCGFINIVDVKILFYRRKFMSSMFYICSRSPFEHSTNVKATWHLWKCVWCIFVACLSFLFKGHHKSIKWF